MKLGIHAVSAKRGGAVTYLQHVLPELVRRITPHPRSSVHLWHGSELPPDAAWLDGLQLHPTDSGSAHHSFAFHRRLYFDQVRFPRALRENGIDALFATANFGVLRPPCHQVLLVRNTVPFDRLLLSRVSRFAAAAYTLQRLLTLQSIRAADIVLFPSAAMRDLVADWTGRLESNWRVAHYGVQHERFAVAHEEQPAAGGAPVRLLHVSSYADQKNLGTLLGAVEKLHRRSPGSITLRLTSGFARDWQEHHAAFPNFAAERAQFRRLAEVGAAEDLDWLPPDRIPDLYRQADIFVFPSYTESFGHPLLEAMASGRAIVAADTPVNRELCGDAAVYAPTFDRDALAEAIAGIASDPGRRAQLQRAALVRARTFSWADHVTTLLGALSAGSFPRST